MKKNHTYVLKNVLETMLNLLMIMISIVLQIVFIILKTIKEYACKIIIAVVIISIEWMITHQKNA